MPVGVPLAEMSTQTRAILGYSLNPAFGVDQEEALREGLRRTQTDLWVMHDWPMLIVQVQKPISAGSRYAALPPELDFNHINAVYARNEPDPPTQAGSWVELGYGIFPENFNECDSELNQRSFPVKRYMPTALSNNQIELWPIPDKNSRLLFRGRVSLKPLVVDEDVCTLDSDLIIATYAAQMLQRNGNPDAQIQLARAQQILNRLRARQGANKRQPWVPVGYLEGGVI